MSRSLLCICLACAVSLASCGAPDSDRATPRQALVEFCSALTTDGDPQRLREMVTGSEESVGGVVELGRLLAALRELDGKVSAHYGEAAFPESEGVVDFHHLHLTADEARLLPVIDEGDVAYIPRPGGDGWTRLVKRRGRWKIDADAVWIEHQDPSWLRSLPRVTAAVRDQISQVGKPAVTPETIRAAIGEASMEAYLGQALGMPGADLIQPPPEPADDVIIAE